MNLFANLPSIPLLRPMFNIGAGLDIITGTYYIGSRGESVLNGGASNVEAIAGPPNSFKSTIIIFRNLVIAERIRSFQLGIYETESTLTYNRIKLLAAPFPKLSQIDHGDPDLDPNLIKVKITASCDILGDIYFEEVSNIASLKKNAKAPYLTTPFVQPNGKPITMLPPTGFLLDSFSEFKVSAQEDGMVAKNKVGSSDLNMLYMRNGLAKKHLITQLPHMCVNSAIYMSMTVHIGDEFNMEGPMAPKKHKLVHSKKGSKMTGVTKALEYLSSGLIEITNIELLNNKEYQTGVLYPATSVDREKNCTDLLLIHLCIVRNKNGLSGIKTQLVVSQKEGVLPHLTLFHMIKEGGRFGLIGNNVNYTLALIPTISLSRTTVRSKINDHADLRRGLEIVSEMYQILTLWAPLPDQLMCTPLELYNDLKTLGYDWDILLKTRGYWVFKEDEAEELPFLSTLDLLRMRKGLYSPYFLNEDKITYKKTEKHLLNK